MLVVVAYDIDEVLSSVCDIDLVQDSAICPDYRWEQDGLTGMSYSASVFATLTAYIVGL